MRFGILQRQLALPKDAANIAVVAVRGCPQEIQLGIHNDSGDVIGEDKVQISREGYALLSTKAIKLLLNIVGKEQPKKRR